MALHGQTPSFRATAELVSVDVSVRSGQKLVRGLSIEDFELTDNGVVQRLTSVQSEQLPIDVTFVLDRSGSVTAALARQLAESIDATAAKLRTQDACDVIAFNQSIREVMGSRTCAASKRPDIEAGAGATSLVDALMLSLITPPAVERRRLVLAFTDGLDTVSFFNLAAAEDLAKRGDGVLFGAVGTTQPRSRPTTVTLGRIALATGGDVTELQSGENPSNWFAKIFDEFRSGYVLHFAPRGVAPAGWHELKVRVIKSGRYSVRARAGYLR